MPSAPRQAHQRIQELWTPAASAGWLPVVRRGRRDRGSTADLRWGRGRGLGARLQLRLRLQLGGIRGDLFSGRGGVFGEGFLGGQKGTATLSHPQQRLRGDVGGAGSIRRAGPGGGCRCGEALIQLTSIIGQQALTHLAADVCGEAQTEGNNKVAVGSLERSCAWAREAPAKQ